MGPQLAISNAAGSLSGYGEGPGEKRESIAPGNGAGREGAVAGSW